MCTVASSNVFGNNLVFSFELYASAEALKYSVDCALSRYEASRTLFTYSKNNQSGYSVMLKDPGNFRMAIPASHQLQGPLKMSFYYLVKL